MPRPLAAIVTCAARPQLYAEEAELPKMLAARGVDAEPVVWDDAGVDWRRFDAVVIRSTWDYFTRYPEFSAWLARVEAAAPLWNSAPLVRWNADKRYLRDLEARGVRVVPTAYCEAGAPASLGDVMRARGWDHAVLKPAISGGALRTHRVDARDAGALQGEMDAILATTTALVQPFMPEIQTEGEWSFLFFDGAFRFAVLKLPTAGDYRVQTDLGGTFTRVEPEVWMIDQARDVVRALPEAPVYARIDCVRRGREMLLMEAELIEPYLYLAAAPEEAEAYVGMIERVARAGQRARG